MSKFYVTEYAGFNPNGIPAGPPLAETVLTIGANANSVVCGPNTRGVRLHADAICSYNTNGADATATDPRMAASTTDYMTLNANAKVSVITNV